MGMFNTTGKQQTEGRTDTCLEKLARLKTAMSHEEPDRVPISDFFWGSFIERWRKDLGLPDDANPYYHYDLDWIVTVCNMDPWIRSFQTLEEDDKHVVVKTGFGVHMRKTFEYPMPEMFRWDLDTIEKLEAAEFDPPDDPRRFYSAGDNQIAGVGDGFERNSPAWIETVKSLRPDFPVFGSVIECSEFLTRAVGQANALLWMGLYPERLGRCLERVGRFYFDMARAEMDAGEGLLDGFVIWGDVAYGKGMLFSPDYWRAHFKPWVKAIADHAHDRGLMVFYHGCGNVHAIIRDFAEIGIDAYNPLEVKAGMDAVDLRRELGHTIGFCGNSDMRVWETGDRDQIRAEVLHRLNAAKGGGFIFQSDHSVASDVSGQTYDYIVKLVRDRGRYPLDLGDGDEEV